MNMMRLIGAGALAFSLSAAAADRTVSENWTLTQNETVDGSLIVPSGVTVDLNGFKLTAQGLHSGSAPILTDENDLQYEQLEYVITTGGANGEYVQTTYVPGTKDRVELLVEFFDDLNHFLYSTRDNNYSNAFSCYRKSGASTRFDFGSNQGDLSVSTTANGNRYYIIQHAGYPNNGATQGGGFVRVNDASTTSFTEIHVNKANFNPKDPFVLFAASHWVNGVIEPGSTTYAAKCKFYHFQVKRGDTVTCNIVPAKRVSDGVVGLFDTVAGKFLVARRADNTQAETSFAQYGAMEAEGGTVTSPGSGDLTVNESSRVSSIPAQGLNGYYASALFNNNFTHSDTTGKRFIMEVGNLPLKVDYDFGEGTPRMVTSYKVWFGQKNGAEYANRAPKAWKFYGSNDKDNNDWKLLDERTNETGWSPNNKARSYEVQNVANIAAYRWYRIEITENNGGTHMEFVQLEYFSPRGTLCIDVPDGTSTTNSAISITGGVVVEKDGPGTLSMTKRNDGFGGEGVTTLVVKNGKVTRTPNKILPTCGAAKSTISVLDGGQFDLAGYNYYDYKYTIAGDGPDGRGALVNDVLAAGFQNQGAWYADIWHGFLGDVTLADDATIGGTETFGMLYYAAAVGGSYAATTMTMNGHTLTYAMPAPKAVYSWSMYNYNGEGGIRVAEGCQFSFTMGDASRPTSAPDCELVVAGTLNQNNLGATVKSLLFTATGIYTHGTVKPITVYEEYAPNINSTADKNKHPTVTLGASGHTNTVLDLSLFSDAFDSAFTTFYSGSTVTVDTGSRELSGGMKLVSWSAQPNATFELKDGETLRYETVAASDGLYLRSMATPAYAVWDTVSEGWKYYTSENVEVEGWAGGIDTSMQVRFSSVAEYAVITNAVETSGIAPAAFLLTGLPLAEGTDEIDLSGLDFIVESGMTVDVKGNTLTLPNSLVAGSVPFTVTSSVAGGKLVVDVPANGVVINNNVTLSGSLGFVKRGEGMFAPAKLYQTYTGGNVVEAGTLKLSVAHNEHDGYYNELGGFVEGAGAYADVEILPGATVDQNGQTGLRSYNFILKGGTLTNTRTDFGMNKAMFFRISLRDAERSYFTLPNGISTGFYADLDGATTLDLGGKTLELRIPGSKFFYLNNTTISNGTLDVVSGGSLRAMRTASDASNASIILNAALILDKDLSVSNIVIKYNGDWDYGPGALKVYGAFRPEAEGGYFYGPTMQNGSTLDFSQWNADSLGWPVKSRSSRNANVSKTVKFASDAASVKVTLGGIARTKALATSEDPYILKWGDGAEEPSGATRFVFADSDESSSRGYELVSDETGLKVAPKRGFTIRIAEKDVTVPGAWVAKNYAAFGDVEESAIATWLGGTGANGLPRWQSWLLGLEPADASSVVLCVPGQVNTAEGEFAIGANIDVQAGSGAAVTAYLDTSADGKAWDEKVASQALTDGGTVSFSRTLASGERGFYRIRLAVQ